MVYATQLSHLDLCQKAGKANMANFLEEWGRYWQSVIANNVGLKGQINPWLPVLCISDSCCKHLTNRNQPCWLYLCIFKQFFFMSDHWIGHTNTTERTAAFRVRWHGGQNAVCGTCQEKKYNQTYSTDRMVNHLSTSLMNITQSAPYYKHSCMINVEQGLYLEKNLWISI